MPKYCSRHRVGAGRQVWGLGSVCDLVWDKGGGEERQGGLVGLGLVLGWVTGRWSKQVGMCFILRFDQRQTHDHCWSRCWPALYISFCLPPLYILIPTAVSGGTQVNFGHRRSRRALTSWRAWSKATNSRIPCDVSKLLIWPGTDTGLNQGKEKRFSLLLLMTAAVFCFLKQMKHKLLFVFPSAVWITGAHSCWQSLQVRLAAGSSLSSWMLLHIIAVNLSVHRCCYTSVLSLLVTDRVPRM